MKGFSFSWKRALGITAAKQKFARSTGIPTSKAGLERKIGKSVLESLATTASAAILAANLDKTNSKRIIPDKTKEEENSDLNDSEFCFLEVEDKNVADIFAEMEKKVDEIIELKNKITEMRSVTKGATEAKDTIKPYLSEAKKLKDEVNGLYKNVVKTVGASTDKSQTPLLKMGEKKYDDAEKALDKLKTEYDAVFKMLSDLEKKEKKEDEKKKKWWYKLFVSIHHIFVPSSK